MEFDFRKLTLPTINEISFFPLPHVFLALSVPTEQQRRFVDFRTHLYVDNGRLFCLGLQPLYRLEITRWNVS